MHDLRRFLVCGAGQHIIIIVVKLEGTNGVHFYLSCMSRIRPGVDFVDERDHNREAVHHACK